MGKYSLCLNNPSVFLLLCVRVGVLVGRDYVLVVLNHWEKELPWSLIHWDCFSTCSVSRYFIILVNICTQIRKRLIFDHAHLYLTISLYKTILLCLMLTVFLFLSVEYAMGSWVTPLQGLTYGFVMDFWAVMSATLHLGVRTHTHTQIHTHTHTHRDCHTFAHAYIVLHSSWEVPINCIHILKKWGVQNWAMVVAIFQGHNTLTLPK